MDKLKKEIDKEIKKWENKKKEASTGETIFLNGLIQGLELAKEKIKAITG